MHIRNAASSPSGSGPVVPANQNMLETPPVPTQKVLMLSHPRSRATAIELHLERCGFEVECNVFDKDFHFLRNAGACHPVAASANEVDRFENVAARLILKNGPLLVRTAAYTIRPHLENEILRPFLRSFDERIL